MVNKWYEKGELPPVGEVVQYVCNTKPMMPEDCNLDEHCIVDTWKGGEELKVLCLAEMHGELIPVVQNLRTQQVSSITPMCLSPIQSERDKLIEKLCDIVNKDDDCRKFNVSIDCSVSQKAIIEAVVNAGWRPKDV